MIVRAEFSSHLRHILSRPPDLSITATTLTTTPWTWSTWTGLDGTCNPSQSQCRLPGGIGILPAPAPPPMREARGH